MQFSKIADHCGGCQEFRPTAQDEEANTTLGSCQHNPRPASISDTSPKCLAYRPFPEVAGKESPVAKPSGMGSSRPSIELGMAKDTMRAIVRDVLYELLGPEDVEMGDRWDGGRLVMEPGRPGVLGKEVPIEAFFKKIIMVRDRLRVLEAKINANDHLPYTDKLELQGYITKCYGSLTTFNVLFAEERDRFVGEKKGR